MSDENTKAADATLPDAPGQLGGGRMECYILKSHLVSAPCCRCKNEALPAHNVGMELFCGSCCPIHGFQASAEWVGDAKTISGEQPSLFEKAPIE